MRKRGNIISLAGARARQAAEEEYRYCFLSRSASRFSLMETGMLPFATWTVDYVVYSMLSILIWIVVIFGIPIAIGIIWWINHEMKKNP